MLIVLLLVSVVRADAEMRCGWLENPTPANWWLVDGDGTWILSTQGSPEPKGMDLIPDVSAHDFVKTNGSYGYACACLDARFDGDKSAIEIKSVRQLPLGKCRKDRSLPKP